MFFDNFFKKSYQNVLKDIFMLKSEPEHVLRMFLFFHQI